MTAPERIWAFSADDIAENEGGATIVAHESYQPYAAEYVRADLAITETQPDPRDEVIAEAEARGMQRAAEICKSAWIQTPEPLTARDCYDAILAAIPKGGE